MNIFKTRTTSDLGEKIIAILIVIVIMAAILAVASLILALPTMLLWNWLMPEIFDLIQINFWQAWGINWLSFLLFKTTNMKHQE